ncbi:MAG: alpha/beta hydrolase [archaeon]|nr:alpha/beta hydrolase [archaeon]
MGWFVKFIFVLVIALSVIYFKYLFTEIEEAILNSFIMGIFVFCFAVLILRIINSRHRKLEEHQKDKIKRRERIVYFIAFMLMLASILFFLNFYLYAKALLGNDLLVSLNSENKNLIIKNGDESTFNMRAKVLTNPFCRASCVLSLKDLSSGEVIYSESILLSVSSPFSKDIPLKIDEETYGQRLYESSLNCETVIENLCYTKTSYQKSRTEIVSVNYELNDFQKEKAENLKKETESLNIEVQLLKNGLNKMHVNSSYLDLSKYENISFSLNESVYSFEPKVDDLTLIYESQKYSDLESKLGFISESLKSLRMQYKVLNSSFYSDIQSYNSLIDNLTSMYGEIIFLENYTFSNSSLEVAESFVDDFNLMVSNMSRKEVILSKIILLNKIENEKEILFGILKEENNSEIIRERNITGKISEVNFSKINTDFEMPPYSFNLKDPSPICCFENECSPCMNLPSSNYPVILLHGHNYNQKLSVESSFEALSGFSQNMEKDGYLNAGSLYSGLYGELSKSYLGKVNRPVVIKVTYYLEPLGKEDPFALNAEWGDIGTYALRLNEIISNVKYITGKDKVIIVAHSMGGLVARRYIQIYGEKEIDKLVLVTVPNKGVDGFVLNYCPIFGADVECGEMNKSSSFMASLSEAPNPKVPVYNLIGIGCFWEGSIGDGIVKNESAYLEGVQNIYFTGECNGLDFFHGNVFDVAKYPEIYEAIKDKIGS